MSNAPPHASNSRLGLVLFAVYSLFYASFVLVNAFAAKVSDWVPFGGLNLAVLWGFALIGLAFVLAVIYGWLCRPEDDPAEAASAAKSEESSV